MASTNDVLEHLNQARNLAFTNKESFPDVLRQIFNLVNNPDIKILRWCSVFIKESFQVDETKLELANKIELAIDSISSLLTLSEVRDLEIFKNLIDTFIIVYKLVFRYVADNDGCTDIWNRLNELKTSLIIKFENNFPYEESFNDEINKSKNLHSKLELIKLIVLVIDYQTKSHPLIKNFSLTKVNPNHTLIKPSSLEPESYAYLDLLLKILEQEIMVAPLITATLNHLVIIIKRKPQFINRVIDVIENFESNDKLQSNYQSLENFKLLKKYVDRGIRIFLNHTLRNQLLPPKFHSSLNKKLTMLINRGDEIRKKNILISNPEIDSKIKKRKFEGFENPNKKIKSNDYKNLYCLNEPSNELNNFDLSSLPQNILVSMTLIALKKVNTKKLSCALDIISDRYTNVINSITPEQLEQQQQQQKAQQQLQQQQQQQQQIKSELPDAYEVNRLEYNENNNDYDDDDDDDDKVGLDYNPTTLYTLPPSKPLTIQEKKDHINLIIKNFFKLAEKDVVEINDKQELNESIDDNEVNKELTKVAIKSWKKDSWLILLTRLATRGMRNIDDTIINDELSDIIRTSIFDYFLSNIHSRIDLIIEWLNEEWFSEKVFNEEKQINKITEETYKFYENSEKKHEINLNELINENISNLKIETPIYDKWARKVLDSMIPFLEPTDRKIFIRLLSDLPFLDDELVSRIKSLCNDPVRSKIGFLSLQFLIMYRPPVKESCINILRSLSESDQDDLRDESKKLLAKYS